MFRSTILSLVLILALAFMVSCSGGGGNVVAPDKGERDVVAEEPGNTVCLGLWQFVADKATGEADLVQLRSADKILNVLGFMEPPPLSMMDLDWPNLNIDFDNGIVDVGVKFTHPINDGIFTGFDVRGVVFGPEVTNADGLTIIPSPEFFKGVPFGYQDGLIGIPDSTANYEGLAGYKYYCDSLGANEDLAEFFSDPANLLKRGRFSPNQTIQRNYNLSWNSVDHNFLDFNYALYANYDWPVGNPPWFVDDWEMSTANSAEAFCCSVTELANNLHFVEGSGGGTISLQVEVWDWQGDIADVTIESFEPGVIVEASYDIALGNMSTDYSYGFMFNSVPGTPTAIGDLDILITATDSKTFGECWFLDLLPSSNAKYADNIYNCWIHTTTVSSDYIDVLTPNGGEEWKPGTNEDIIWTSENVTGTVFIDYSKDNFVSDIHSITTDELNDGTYTWTIPFDPSETVRVRVSSTVDPSVCDVSDVDFTLLDGWARTWGGTSVDYGRGVAMDDSGNAYVTGTFRGTVDFDPGPGTDNHTYNGQDDAFLSKFDSYGNFQWARTWGGGGIDYSYEVAVDDSGNAYVIGYFYGTVDFDPGTGTDNHTSNGHNDAFLSKFDSNGDFQWARTWGGTSYDGGLAVAVDNSGNTCVTGFFRGTTDLDPGPGTDYHPSNGITDIFISKFDSNGDFQWGNTWGGTIQDSCDGVAVDDSGNAYVTGLFNGTVDFDPGPGTDFHTSNGGRDAFLGKFNSSGDFQWARTWGGSSSDRGYGVAVDDSGNAYVTGLFNGTVDFDPGPGVNEHYGHNAFLSNFDSNGDFQWARTWGGGSPVRGLAVAVDNSGNAYVTGNFMYTVDFDPGPGTDNHTSNGNYNAFLSKFDSSSDFQWARTWGPEGSMEGASGFGVAVDDSGNAYVTGFFTYTTDFDPGPEIDNHTTNGTSDVFLIKVLPDGYW